MQKRWSPGDHIRAICETCGVVDARFETRTYRLSRPAIDVADVLVGVCTNCDRVAVVPYQSSPVLNRARKAASLETG